MHAMRAPDAQGVLVLVRASSQGLEQAVEIAEQQVGGGGQLQGKRGVEQVRGGHAEVQIARIGPDHLFDVREERDHVVPGLCLDLRDPLRVDQRHPVSLGGGAHLRRDVARDLADRRHRLQGAELDLEPQAQAMLRRPDRGHLGAGITRNHRHPQLSGRHVIAGRARKREVAIPEDGLQIECRELDWQDSC